VGFLSQPGKISLGGVTQGSRFIGVQGKNQTMTCREAAENCPAHDPENKFANPHF
jgi:hypothetical protein